MLEELGITRDRVYIANVVKCRPPGNRDPQPDEIDACRPYLEQQLELIDPKVVVTLGKFAGAAAARARRRASPSCGASSYPFGDGVLDPDAAPGRGAAGRRRAAGPDAGRPRAGQAGAGRGGRRRRDALTGTTRLGRRDTKAVAAAAGRAGPPRRPDRCWPASWGRARPRSPRGSAPALGVTEPITSPTFTLAAHYEGRLELHHLDVYRLEQLAEVLDLGLPEMLDDGGVTLIEWGDVIVAVAARRLPARCGSTFGDGRRRPRHSSSAPGRAAAGRPRDAGRRSLAAWPPGPRRPPMLILGIETAHRAGRAAPSAATRACWPRPSRRAAAATPRRSPRRSSSSASRPASTLTEISVRRRRPRPRAVHRAAGRRRRRPRRWPTRCGCR